MYNDKGSLFSCVLGWGSSGIDGTATDKLQETIVPIVESSKCIEIEEHTEGIVEDNLICAGGNGSGPCKVRCLRHYFASIFFFSQGDSGGPLTVVNKDGAHVLIGIVSARTGGTCARQEFATFTSVSYLLPWVESSIKENGGMASCSFNISAPPILGRSIIAKRLIQYPVIQISQTCSTGMSMEPSPPPGLLILGGESTKGPLSSVESFGFENCTFPPLPESRYGFGSFITSAVQPQLAVCGGWWMGKPRSTDCLTLNVTSGRWERGSFANGLLGTSVRGVINLESEGVFIVHSAGVSFLAQGSKSWVAGPMFVAPAVCGCNISSKSFVTIHMNSTHNVRQYSVTGNDIQPEPINMWPDLLTKRQGPGCGATSLHLVVAGGVSAWDEVLTSVEVFVLATRALRRGGSLRQPRAFFQIIPIGFKHRRLLAIGGRHESEGQATSEWWEEEEDSWEEGKGISKGRSSTFNFF